MTMGIMEVNLISARGLKNDEYLEGGIDPYVVIQYKNQEHKSSMARGQGSRPEWNEKFNFRAEYPAADNNYKLILTVMDQDRFSADDPLGQATVYVKELVQLGVENGRYETRPTKYNLVGNNQSFCGEIKLSITFTLKETTYDRDGGDCGGWKDSEY